MGVRITDFTPEQIQSLVDKQLDRFFDLVDIADNLAQAIIELKMEPKHQPLLAEYHDFKRKSGLLVQDNEVQA